VFKKSIFVLDLIAIATIIFAPALLIPSYMFGKDVGSVAIIGGDGPTSIHITAEVTKYGNFVFPLFILLIACNFYYLFAFLRKCIRKKEI
jgi:Na+-transporting methylmalonyl-CoA/oxaloacetate decarboxylase beta subunit